MIASIVIYQSSGVILNTGSFEEKSARIASRELLKDDGYANATWLERMAAYTRNILSGKSNYAEVEQAVQIAVARADYQDALDLTRRSIELYDGDNEGLGRLYLRMGYLYVMMRDSENALEWLNRGIALAPTPEAYLSRAQVLLTLNQTEPALDDVSAYLDQAEDPEELLPDLINVYEAAGDYETAAALYTRLIDHDAGAEYLLNRAYCRTNLGQMEEAQADRNLYAEAKGEELASADVMIGIGWMRGGEYTKASESFARAIDENYADPESVYYYVVLCVYVNADYEKACTYGDRLITRLREGKSTETAAFEMEKTTGRLNVKLAEMDIPSLCLMTGASHVRRGDYEQAVESLTECLKADQGVVYANYLRGSCYLAAEHYREAIADFDTSIAAGEEVESSHYGRGVSRMQLGDKAGAIEDFEWVLFNGENDELFEESTALMSKLLNDGKTENGTGTETKPETETKTEGT